jgi:hypothetical protein
MSDLRKAAEMALEFVEWLCGDDHSVKPKNNALKTKEALRQALAEPANSTTDFVEPKASSQTEHEPVAWLIQYKDRHEFVWCNKTVSFKEQVLGIEPLYTAPPKREWVGLTNKNIDRLLDEYITELGAYTVDLIKAVEAKLKKKNT